MLTSLALLHTENGAVFLNSAIVCEKETGQVAPGVQFENLKILSPLKALFLLNCSFTF